MVSAINTLGLLSICLNLLKTDSSSAKSWPLQLSACQPICGPAHVGNVKIIPVTGADPIWIDLGPNRLSSRMIAGDPYSGTHYMFSPHHGGDIGSGYLYSCQPPLCDEPNSPVEGFLASMSYGCAVELTWIAGGGNYTIIRCRTDRYPTPRPDPQPRARSRPAL